MLKKNTIISVLLITILIFFFIGLCFKYERKIEITSNNGKTLYFTGRIFNYHILGKRKDGNFLKTKLLELSKEKIKIIGPLKSQTKQYLVYTIGSIIKLYNIQKGNLKTCEIDDNKVVISGWVSDLDNDCGEELLIITGKGNENFGENIIIFSFKEELKKIYKKHLKGMNPWKVETADVDGDGLKEISIGVYKKSQFHPIMAKRPFIYNWHGNDISPKWRGSRLSRPFEDYIFADIDGDGLDEIVSIEILRDGKELVNAYRWKGFGFEGRAESSQYERVLAIEKIRNSEKNDSIAAKVKNGDKYEWVFLVYTDEKLEIKDTAEEYISKYNVN